MADTRTQAAHMNITEGYEENTGSRRIADGNHQADIPAWEEGSGQEYHVHPIAAAPMHTARQPVFTCTKCGGKFCAECNGPCR